MFTKYWRSYPWFLQLFLFAMMVFIFMGLSQMVMVKAIPMITHYRFEDIIKVTPQSNPSMIRALILTNAIGSFLFYAAPCLLFAYLTHPKPGKYLGLVRPGKNIHWLYAIVIFVGFWVVGAFAGTWITEHIQLPKSLLDEQANNDRIMKSIFTLKSTGDMVLAFVCMTLVPAFGEELIFRGIMMRFANRRSRGMFFPIAISAVFFTLAHGNYLGFPIILTAGVLLGMIYYYTQSLWCNVLAHFLFNGISIFIAFGGFKEQEIPVYVFLIGLLVTLGGFYALWKSRTPLPPNWSDDYTPEELAIADKPLF